MQEFKVNEYITLKLEESKTFLYVGNEKFRQCFQLIIQISKNNVSAYDLIDSIDEAAGAFSKEIERKEIPYELKIPPEEEFWGHCSNLQAWYENDYDTRLLHSNLAFPLLHELFKLNDPKAKRVFKDEVAKRLKSGYPSVVEFLISQRYLIYFNGEELDTLFEDFDYDLILTQRPSIMIRLYNYFVRLGALGAKKTILNEISNRFYSDNPQDIEPLFKLGYKALFLLFERERECFPPQNHTLTESTAVRPKEMYKNKFFQKFKEGNYAIINELIENSYFKTLTHEEIISLIKDIDYDLIIKQNPKWAPSVFSDLMKTKASGAKSFYKNYVFELFNSGNNSMIAFLIRNHYLQKLDHEDIKILLEKIDYDYIKEHEDAFILFRILKYLGAPKAEEEYKEAIVKLIKSGKDFYNTANSIINGLLDEYSSEYIHPIFEGYDYEYCANQYPEIIPLFLEKLIKLGVSGAKKYYESEEFLQKNLSNDEIPFFLDLSSKLDSPINISRPNLDWNTPSYAYPPGITIVNKRIIEIDLKRSKIDELPDSIEKLIQLRKLNLLENCLHSLPSSMSNLKVLKEIELGHNKFDEFPPVVFQLSTLEKLSVKMNSIEEIPDTFSKLSSLEFLDLSSNNLKVLPKSILDLKNLKILYLNFNELDSIPENIGKLESLEEMFCDYNNLRVLPESIGYLRNLKRLHVDGNPLMSIPETILEIYSLELLSINPKYLDENVYSILDLLSEENLFISKPPYSIDFGLNFDVSYFSSNDQNTRKKYGRFIAPEELPLRIKTMDKLNIIYEKYYNGYKEAYTPEFKDSVFKTFEKIKNQLEQDFTVHISSYFLDSLKRKVSDKEPLIKKF